MSDNYITYVAEDHAKKIWFGTWKGGYILDKITNRIIRMDLGKYSEKNIYSINVTRDGTIWVSVSGALLRFRPDGKLIRQYNIKYNHAPQSVYTIYEDKDRHLLISITGGGMYKLNKAADKFEAYFHHTAYMDIEKIIWDEVHKCYWLATWGKGIVRFDPREKKKELQYLPQPLPKDASGVPTGNIYHMVQDDVLHYLWITTQHDLFAFRITGQATLEQINTSSFFPPGNKVLYEIYKDKAGKLWVSAFDRPSFIVDIHPYTVKEYPLIAIRDQLKAYPALTTLCVDGDGVFWFSQDRYGLCMYDPKTDKFKHYSECREIRNLPFWEVSDMIASRWENRTWAITNSSTVYKLKRENGEMKLEMSLNIADVTNVPGTNTSLFEDNHGDLWIGTTTGLFVYRRQASTLEVISARLGHVTGITQTMDGRIWCVIKNKGICETDRSKKDQNLPL